MTRMLLACLLLTDQLICYIRASHWRIPMDAFLYQFIAKEHTNESHYSHTEMSLMLCLCHTQSEIDIYVCKPISFLKRIDMQFVYFGQFITFCDYFNIFNYSNIWLIWICSTLTLWCMSSLLYDFFFKPRTLIWFFNLF